MGLFRRGSSASSGTSRDTETSDTASASSATSVSTNGKKPVKVKASDLNFANTASPNSRVLALSPEASEPLSLGRTNSTLSSQSNRSAANGSAGGSTWRRNSTVSDNDKRRNSKSSPPADDGENQSYISSATATAGAAAGAAAAAVGSVIGRRTSVASDKSAPKVEPVPESDSESEESDGEDQDRPPASKKASTPVPKRANSASSAQSLNSTTSSRAAGIIASTSHDLSESESEESESEDSYSESETGDSETDGDYEANAGGVNREAIGVEKPSKQFKKQPKSHAAKLAAKKMEEDIPTKQKMNKKLSTLTYNDVKLTEDELRADIENIWKAMHLFMNSRMVEAEEICTQAADHRLYYSVGYSLIQAIKSLATFEPEDLDAAISCCKDSIVITQLLRKKDHGIMESGLRLAKGSTSVNSIKGMTLVQRHAELIYAECTLLKAVLGIIYSGDFIAFLKEALNMRNAYAIYRTLAKYVEVADKAYGGEDPSIDQDFRSGVFLGNGLISLILSLLPATVLKIMEVFGFTGDREYALRTLMKGGKWKAGQPEPGMPVEKEGIRRQICDMVLLTHHLVIASYLPVGGVDVPTAANILHYNLDRYPNGVFFLYFAGRLHSTETQLESAIKAFHLAIQAQKEYIQLAHICYWDMGLVSLAMATYDKGYDCFNILDKESNWSKAIYAYAKGTTIYEQGRDLNRATEIMRSVPDLMQRIAGKSIPLEKFVARRARKYIQQGNRLCLPGIELAYFLNCLGLSPRFVLFEKHLDQVSVALSELHQCKDPSKYGKSGKGDEYWDDYCLAHLLRGIILRFIAFPEPHTKPRPAKSPIPQQEAGEQALISFNNVLKHGRDIVYDHHLVWFTHYELGRLFEAKKEYAKAQEQYNIVMSGKNMEISTKKGKGKVTLQNMVVLRTNSALTSLKDAGRV